MAITYGTLPGMDIPNLVLGNLPTKGSKVRVHNTPLDQRQEQLNSNSNGPFRALPAPGAPQENDI